MTYRRKSMDLYRRDRRAAVLAELRETGTVTNQQLQDKFLLSRDTIQRDVQYLRDSGHEIDGIRGTGYVYVSTD